MSYDIPNVPLRKNPNISGTTREIKKKLERATKDIKTQQGKTET